MARAGDVAWFGRLGAPLTAADLECARAYLQSFDRPDLPIHGVSSPAQALDISNAPHWDQRWWEVESDAMDALRAHAESLLGRARALQHLSQVAADAADAIYGAACQALGGAELLAKVAAGAAALSLHQVTLARLSAVGPTHVFMRKYALFESGRWPLGVLDNTFHLY